ncbi:LacI family DNA-binding transcriptional regulator [Planctomycetota bacterium]|nr:LacI family DNA-binding transcriptional regulator [Planctomycetota bacterium]
MKKSTPNISISKVAKEARVSIATVSRVLHKHPSVKATTARKVQAVIQDLGYKPGKHSSPRNPRQNRSPLLKHHTVLLLWTGGRAHTGQQLQEGVATAMRRHNINLIVDYITDNWTPPPVLRQGQIDGILLHGPPLTPKYRKFLSKFPAVWLYYQGGSEWGDRVQPDHRLVGQLALQYLIKQDCSNLCVASYAPTSDTHTYHTERSDAFQQAAHLHGYECQTIGHSLPQPKSQRGLYEFTSKIIENFLSLPNQPDGLFVANDLCANVHDQLIRNNITPMKDVILVGSDCDNIADQRHLEPPPVMFDINAYTVGQLAVQLLLTRISLPNLPRMTQLIEPEILIP